MQLSALRCTEEVVQLALRARQRLSWAVGAPGRTLRGIVQHHEGLHLLGRGPAACHVTGERHLLLLREGGQEGGHVLDPSASGAGPGLGDAAQAEPHCLGGGRRRRSARSGGPRREGAEARRGLGGGRAGRGGLRGAAGRRAHRGPARADRGQSGGRSGTASGQAEGHDRGKAGGSSGTACSRAGRGSVEGVPEPGCLTEGGPDATQCR
mmetsp:Transcript_1187/g.3337  ORF Transcript_1187/g.3337 Transcript_1187/m.3337 type:complete len:209 (-) Transcript_1187:134-760(-)